MSDDLGIEISEVEEKPENQLRRLSPDTETLVGLEKGIFVKLGIPEKNGAIIVPETPHVFIADELRISDRSHTEPLLLKNVVVLTGHGIRNEQDEWKFVNGQGVTDTVNACSEYFKSEGLPQIEFLAVCNKDRVTQETGVAVSEGGLSDVIAYAAGTEVNVQGVIEPNGTTRVYIQSPENMFNLDILQTAKAIEIIE